MALLQVAYDNDAQGLGQLLIPECRVLSNNGCNSLLSR